MTEELPPSRWDFPSPDLANAEGLVGVGADLDPGSLLEGYRRGLFPMPLGQPQMLGWWSPDPRGVIPLDGLHVSRSLRSACRKFEVRVDTAFAEVVAMCADTKRPGSWISPEFATAYVHLHELGWAHSFEAWSGGRLAGGLYGVAIGGFFAGESMFHRVTNASKVALVAAVETVRSGGGSIFDVQWTTPHLRSLGAVDLARADYLRLLESAVTEPTWLASGRL